MKWRREPRTLLLTEDDVRAWPEKLVKRPPPPPEEEDADGEPSTQPGNLPAPAPA